MPGERSEAATKDRPVVQPASEHHEYSEFQAASHLISVRFGVSIERARLTLALLRGIDL